MRRLFLQMAVVTLAIELLSGCDSATTEPPTATPTPPPPPPTEAIESTPSAPTVTHPATIVELPDGTRCVLAGTSATLAFEGKRLNYTCEVEGQEVGLLGDPQQSEGVWTVERAIIGHDDSGFFLESSEEVRMVIERVELADGTHCVFAGTGATLAFEGKRLNYPCEVEGSDEVGLLGDLQQSEGIWTAEKAIIGHDDSGFFVKESEVVTIARVGGGAVSGIANPASVYCEEQGGQVELREESGGQAGYCIFADGSECEEWAFFRGECAPGGYRPLDAAECTALADAMQQALGVAVTTEEAPFEDHVNDQSGTGCQMTATGTGLDFGHLGVVSDAMLEMLQTQGWQEDIQYAGGGAGGMIAGYRKANGLCLMVASAEPAEDGLCPQDEPFAVCWEELTPAQKRYTVTLNCAQSTAAATSEPKPTRIQFAAGATSAQVQGTLAAGGINRYVLTAMAGQEMTANLTIASAGGSPATSAILAIWGADGTVLISDHADATTWTGELPSTQDYTIDVRSTVQTSVDYTLEVIIPPE